jgi:hypothetical protein
MDAHKVMALVGQSFTSGTHVDFNRHNFIVYPDARSVNYDALAQFVHDIEQAGGGRPRVDIQTAPGEFQGSEVTPADDARIALCVWLEVQR